MPSEPFFPCAGLSVAADLGPQRLALPGLHCSKLDTGKETGIDESAGFPEDDA